MGDVYTGFDVENVYQMARKYFPKVDIRLMESIGCECSGRSAQILATFMQKVTQIHKKQNFCRDC